MYYDAPGNVPGAQICGYGYDVRFEDLSSSTKRKRHHVAMCW